jgi:hypothetical protein
MGPLSNEAPLGLRSSLSPVEGLLYQISGTANSTFALCCHPEPTPSQYISYIRVSLTPVYLIGVHLTGVHLLQMCIS